MKDLASNPLPEVVDQRTARRVMICGWYGTETLGDKAILGGVMSAIRASLQSVDFTLISLFPYVSELSRRQMDDLKGCRIVNSQEGARLVGGMDLVVFGGGPLMALDELADMEAIFGAAKARSVPSMIAGCGVGPLGTEWHNASLKNILSLASLRIYRDEKSRILASELGVDTSTDLVAEDPAFTWLYNQHDQLLSRPPNNRKVLLLGLRDFPCTTYARHLSPVECQAAKQRYERVVVQALETLAEQYPDLLIRPLPMCTNHFGDDDRWFYRRLFRGNTKLKDRLDTSLLGAELPPLDYCEAFRSAHVALTMRFHSVVFALGLDVPAVAIDYTLGKGKVQAIAERFGVPCQNLAELDANFIVREVSKQLIDPKPQALGFAPIFTDVVQKSLTKLLQPGH